MIVTILMLIDHESWLSRARKILSKNSYRCICAWFRFVQVLCFGLDASQPQKSKNERAWCVNLMLLVDTYPHVTCDKLHHATQSTFFGAIYQNKKPKHGEFQIRDKSISLVIGHNKRLKANKRTLWIFLGQVREVPEGTAIEPCSSNCWLDIALHRLVGWPQGPRDNGQRFSGILGSITHDTCENAKVDLVKSYKDLQRCRVEPRTLTVMQTLHCATRPVLGLLYTSLLHRSLKIQDQDRFGIPKLGKNLMIKKHDSMIHPP